MTPEEEYTYELERELERTRAELAASRAEVARLREAMKDLMANVGTREAWDRANAALAVDTPPASVTQE